MKQDLTNQFFDINKLPKEKGLLLFGLSMNKLDFGGQSPKDCLSHVRNFTPSKVLKPLIGLNFLYSDFLYLYSDKPAPELKNSFMNSIIRHKNGIQKILEKNNLEFQIQDAFNYLTWSQLYVGTRDFHEKLRKIKEIYSNDKNFQKYMIEDCELFAREMHENQINFFLEEITMFYLMLKNQVKLPNDFIENQQKWILFCYPGKPLKSTIYLFQLNPFSLNWSENPYQNSCYDLKSKTLYDFDRLDLETWNYE